MKWTADDSKTHGERLVAFACVEGTNIVVLPSCHGQNLTLHRHFLQRLLCSNLLDQNKRQAARTHVFERADLPR